MMWRLSELKTYWNVSIVLKAVDDQIFRIIYIFSVQLFSDLFGKLGFSQLQLVVGSNRLSGA